VGLLSQICLGKLDAPNPDWRGAEWKCNYLSLPNCECEWRCRRNDSCCAAIAV